jgi:hypothetical protein
MSCSEPARDLWIPRQQKPRRSGTFLEAADGIRALKRSRGDERVEEVVGTGQLAATGVGWRRAGPMCSRVSLWISQCEIGFILVPDCSATD